MVFDLVIEDALELNRLVVGRPQDVANKGG